MPKLPAKKPKIALVHWPINDVGGINSWCKNFIKGLDALGVENQLYYSTVQTRYDCHPDREIKCPRYSRLAAKHLSYMKRSIKSTVATLNQYDLILFVHPSPHPTRLNTKADETYGWQDIYREVKAKKFVVIHDVNWQKTNAWFAEVADHVDALMAAQAMFMTPALAYPADIPKKWEYFPLLLRDPTTIPKKHPEAVICTQWVKLKNHRHFIPQLSKAQYPINFYGSGQEYYELRKTSEFVQHVTDRNKTAINGQAPDEKAVFHSYVPYEDLLNYMAQASVSMDLSIKGQVNMTHWEPMTMRTVSMIEKRVLAHPDCQIPEHCCYAFDLDNAVEDINQAIRSSIKLIRIRNQAEQFIKITDHVAVVSRTLDWLAKERVIRNWR